MTACGKRGAGMWSSPAGSDLRPAARRIDAATGLRALAWTERRGNAVRSLELQRNILVLVMVGAALGAVMVRVCA